MLPCGRTFLGWLVFFLQPLAIFATTSVWDGGDSSNNISAPLNWAGDTAPMSDLANTDLVFSGLVRLSPNVDSIFAVHSLSTDPNDIYAATFTFSGATLQIGSGGIATKLAKALTFENAIDFSGVASSHIDATNAAIRFDNLVSLPTDTFLIHGPRSVTVGDFSGACPITLSGAADFRWSPTNPVSNDLFVEDGGVAIGLYEPTRTHTFTSSSHISIGATGSFVAYENVILNGTTLTQANGGSLAAALTVTMTLQNGANALLQGPLTAQQGRFVVTGANSILSLTGNLRINERLSVLAGGKVSSSGSFSTDGTSLVDGTGSDLSAGNLSIGVGGGTVTFSNGSTGEFARIKLAPGFSGTYPAPHFLNIQSGASVSCSGLSVAPDQLSKNATVTVTGSGSALNLTGGGSTNIGTSSSGSTGTGTLNLQSGGTFTDDTGLTIVNTTGTLAIGGGVFYSQGDFILDGGQLTRDAAGVFSVGANRTITIQAGGRATFTGGYQLPDGADLLVMGANSLLTCTGNFRVTGSSSLEIENAGSLGSVGTLEIGDSNGGYGIVTVDSGGTLSVSTNTDIKSGGLAVNAGGTLTGAGSFTGINGINLYGAYLPGGSSSPNQTAAVSFAQYLFLQTSTSITLKLGGLVAGSQYDQISFNNYVSLGGTLRVVLINNFIPQAGESFKLFVFDPSQSSSQFGRVTLPPLPTGLFWRSDRLYLDGTIRVSLTAQTFALWQSGFGAGSFTADDDYDGIANGIEYLLGTNPKTASNSSAVFSVAAISNGAASVTFQIPVDPGDDAHYRVQASANLVNWTTIALKDGSSAWSGSAAVNVMPLANGAQNAVTVIETLPAQATSRFYRLAAVSH